MRLLLRSSSLRRLKNPIEDKWSLRMPSDVWFLRQSLDQRYDSHKILLDYTSLDKSFLCCWRLLVLLERFRGKWFAQHSLVLCSWRDEKCPMLVDEWRKVQFVESAETSGKESAQCSRKVRASYSLQRRHWSCQVQMSAHHRTKSKASLTTVATKK